jgi:hypothetical protein
LTTISVVAVISVTTISVSAGLLSIPLLIAPHKALAKRLR